VSEILSCALSVERLSYKLVLTKLAGMRPVGWSGQASNKSDDALQSFIDHHLKLVRGLDPITLVVEFLKDFRKIALACVPKKFDLLVGVSDEIVVSRSNFLVLRLQLFETLLHDLKFVFEIG
jgi:hypothetical protein